MRKSTISSQVIESFAKDRRTIAADWRIHIAYMRIALSNNYALPDATKANRLITTLLTAGDIERIEQIAGVYRITVPFASVLMPPDEAFVQEASPTAVFSHFTAAQYHNLTYEIPNEIHLTQYRQSSDRMPLGTTPEDWIDVPEPAQRTPKFIGNTQIHWHKAKPEWDFGYTLGHVKGYPIYVTDIERTVLDAIRFPDRCGGATEVLQIWKRAINTLNVDVLLAYVEMFQQTLLKQRVGYILEQAGITHKLFDKWSSNSVRGSSAKLFANLDFSPNYSTRWNLSINAPDAILTNPDDE